MALGLMHAVRDAGLDVPGDVSIVGFDDIPEAAHFAPPLTTVRQDFAELGRRCIGELLAEIAGRAPSSAASEASLAASPTGGRTESDAVHAVDTSGDGAHGDTAPGGVRLLVPELIVRRSTGLPSF